MQFEYDPEKLIQEIKIRRGLWDHSSEDFRCKTTRNSLWTEVVNQFITPDTKATKGEKRELGLLLQKKWKSMRDCFLKYLNNPNRTKRPYIYFKQLQFLLKDQEPPQKDETENSSDSDDGAPLKAKRTMWKQRCTLKRTQLKKEESESDDNTQDNYQEEFENFYPEVTEEVRPPKVAKVDESQLVNTDDFVFANVNAHSEADRMFLLSLLPHLRLIPEENKLNVKLELMQVLKNANYSYMRENNKLV